MTASQPKRKYHKWTRKLDTSPVVRPRFTENELRLVLESVTHYADFLSQEKYPKLKEEWSRIVDENMKYHQSKGEQWLGVKLGDPQFEAYEKIDSEKDDIKRKVSMLNLIERQLRLKFKLIEPKVPQWVWEVPGRVLH